MSVLALLLTVLLAPARGQELQIRAEVDRNAISVGDHINLQVTVSGPVSNLPEPQLPSLPNFSVVSSGQIMNMAFVNGQVSNTATYNFELQARVAGKAVIAPVTVSYQGKSAATQPIEIAIGRPGQPPPPAAAGPPKSTQVLRGSAAAPPGKRGKDLFVAASVDKPKLYVNEQLTLTVRFYTAVPTMGGAEYSPPSTQGFFSEDLPPVRRGQATIGGRGYDYSEVKLALFPAQPGILDIGPASVRCQVPGEGAMDPFSQDFLQRFFAGGGGRAVTVRSEPLKVDVRLLPEQGKPADFGGAVGQFKLTAAVDRAKVKAGDAINLTLTITGAGNLKSIAAPKIAESPSIKVFDTVATMDVQKGNDLIHGTKTFKTVLVPRSSGKLQIPAIAFSYFDPAAGRYVTQRSSPIGLDVAPGAPGQNGPSYVPSASAPELGTVSEDIRYIKEGGALRPWSKVLRMLAAATWPHAIPFGLFIGALGLDWRRRELERDPVRVRFRGAYSQASRKIESARQSNGHAQATALLSDALSGYLGDKLNRPAFGLTLRDASQELARRFPALEATALTELKGLWEEFESLRFAPAGKTNASAVVLAERLNALLQRLDKELKA